MRSGAIAGAICCACMLLTAAGAAAKAPIPTKITRDGAMVVGGQLFTVGHVTSRNSKCLVGRTVRLVYFYPEGNRLVDTDRTSASGVWAGVGNALNLSGLRFTVIRKTFGPRGHRRTCAAASGQITD